MRIRWLYIAIRDLAQLRAYIRRNNPVAASQVAQRVRTAVEVLRTQPNIGRPGRVPGTRELVVRHTPCVIPYRVKGKVVEILRVYQSSRRWPESFDE